MAKFASPSPQTKQKKDVHELVFPSTSGSLEQAYSKSLSPQTSNKIKETWSFTKHCQSYGSFQG